MAFLLRVSDAVRSKQHLVDERCVLREGWETDAVPDPLPVFLDVGSQLVVGQCRQPSEVAYDPAMRPTLWRVASWAGPGDGNPPAPLTKLDYPKEEKVGDAKKPANDLVNAHACAFCPDLSGRLLSGWVEGG